MTDFKLISDQFRETVSALPSVARLNLEFTLRDLLGYKDVRNIQLFTRFGKQQRDFITEKKDPAEKQLRTNLAALIIRGQFTTNKPTKEKFFPADKRGAENAKKLEKYLTDDFTAQAGYKIGIDGGSGAFFYEYFNDSDDQDDASTEISPEDLIEIIGEAA